MTPLEQFLDQFFNFEVAGKKVTLPYWRNDLGKGISGPCGGKGTPSQIHEAVLQAAASARRDVAQMSGEQIYALMRENRIGLDCSGFAYQILDFLDQQHGGDGIADKVQGVRGRGVGRTNADALTNEVNTVPVPDLTQARVGDLIRLAGGGHVVVITQVDKKLITYAHISQKTQAEGPHLSRIEIVEPEAGLEGQRWLEMAKDGTNYGNKCFSVTKGDGVRRLKCWV